MDGSLIFRNRRLTGSSALSGESQVKRSKLLLATHNEGKRRELQQMLADLPFNIFDLTDFPATHPIPETANTFIENATLKAVGYAKQTGLLTLADDSGLEVDALNGVPGVFSARYAFEGASDVDRTKKLLSELSRVPDSERTARFVSVIVVADENAQVINTSEGICEGSIAYTPAGTQGFGYDPVFVPKGFDLTFGQLESSVKNSISHRARAFSAAKEFLRTLTATSQAD